mgnify:CR=1 FL=1|jgi:hypothetical protein
MTQYDFVKKFLPTIEDAIKYALEGACLIKQPRK